jgi:four helix bundle suffix protein
MTNMTNKTEKKNFGITDPIRPIGSIGPTRLIPLHGGFRKLFSYQMARIIYDLTVIFCKAFLDIKSRTNDQMIQAARSGVQNIAEGSQASGTSKKTELKLTNVARASLEELLLDYEDFLRQHGLSLWNKNTPEACTVRELSYRTDKTYMTYMTYMKNQEPAANYLICLIHQTNYLLDQLLKRQENDFIEHGGFTERLYTMRKSIRSSPG